MKKVLIILCCNLLLQISALYAQCSGNLVQNHSFSNGLANWQTFSGYLPNPITTNVSACLDTYMVLRAYNNNMLLPPQDGDGMYQPAVIDSGKCYNLCACMSPDLSNPSSFNKVQFWAATNDPSINYTSLYNNTFTPGAAQLIGIIPVNIPNGPQQYCINGWVASKNFTRLIIFNSTDSLVSQVYIDDICMYQAPVCPVCTNSGLSASFTYNVVNGTTVQFTNTSTITNGNIIGYQWNFNDIVNAPNDTSTQQNPTFTFSSFGAFFVCLKVFADVNGFTCVDSFCIDVVVSPTPPDCDTTGLNNDFTYVISNNTVSFTGISTAATAWSWDFGDPASGPNNFSSAQNPTHAFSSAGSYNVCLIISYSGNSGNVCYDTICKILQIVITDISQADIESQIKIYPNPTKNYVVVENAQPATIEVYDLSGKQKMFLSNYDAAKNTMLINTSNFERGVYLMKIRTSGKVETVKLIKL